MHAGDDIGDHDDGQPVVGSQQEPRGQQPRVRRYGTYLRLVIVSLLVGLVVGVGSWWYFKPQEIPINPALGRTVAGYRAAPKVRRRVVRRSLRSQPGPRGALDGARRHATDQ